MQLTTLTPVPHSWHSFCHEQKTDHFHQRPGGTIEEFSENLTHLFVVTDREPEVEQWLGAASVDIAPEPRGCQVAGEQGYF
jgi:hypothetical protein